MTLELNAAKLMGLFTPLWLLLGLSMALNWSAWVAEPINFVWTVGPPFANIALATDATDLSDKGSELVIVVQRLSSGSAHREAWAKHNAMTR